MTAIEDAAASTRYTTAGHPHRPEGWPIGWGDEGKGHYADIRPVTVKGDGDITDAMVAAYLAKYATKSTETTGHVSGRLTGEVIDLYANPNGSHPERLIDAAWTLGAVKDWAGLRRWAHMLGFGGHFLTKSRRYSITFTLLRNQRIVYRRTQTAGPEQAEADTRPTTLVVNFLQFVGAGWQTPADAMLANTSAAMAREHQETARQVLTTLAA